MGTIKLAASAALAFAIAFAGGPAAAVDKDGRFSIRGAGAMVCKDYLNANPAQKLTAETWWAGYLTAANRFTSDTWSLLGDVTVAQMNVLLGEMCQANPDKLFGEIVNQALEKLYPTRQRQAPAR